MATATNMKLADETSNSDAMLDSLLQEQFRWQLALDAIRVFVVLQGSPKTTDKAVIVVKAAAGPVREAWLSVLTDALHSFAIHTLPCAITPERLLGGLDLPATLASGKRVVQSGLLASADGAVIKVPMADLLPEAVSAQLTGVLDEGGVRLERDGESAFLPTRFGLVLLDESEGDADGGEGLDPALIERAALHVDLDRISVRALDLVLEDEATVLSANPVANPIADPVADACGLCAAFGLMSMRAPLQLLSVARALAALDEREELAQSDMERAVQLSLLGRATTMPASAAEPQEETEPEEVDQQPEPDNSQDNEPPEPEPTNPDQDRPDDESEDEVQEQEAETELPPDEMLVEALVASLPPGLLEQLRQQLTAVQQSKSSGRKGRSRGNALRGRPLGARRGALSAGKRLDMLATLRAAAPWQTFRQKQVSHTNATKNLHLRPSDFHLRRFKQKTGSTTVFVVDASGSTALNRLAEAKGAVELLLAESYARRDHVGLVAFRGKSAQVLLDPTRSLVRAKRSLATLPGGGGTPLASGLAEARSMALEESRKGRRPTIVLITDGSANVALDGGGGRAKAMEEALSVASTIRVEGYQCVLIDVGRQPSNRTQRLADAMGARYVAMPFASAHNVSAAVSNSLSAPRRKAG
ncbi:MAG: magnesium chelatase subunit D [Pseudomonadota bacterium]